VELAALQLVKWGLKEVSRAGQEVAVEGEGEAEQIDKREGQ
jgi:hypothetical protein